MSKNAILTLLTETPLHPGTGQNVGAIDLPVQRERHTGFPFVPSSSLKGALRSNLDIDVDTKSILFGAELGSAKHFAGAMAFSDTRILAFPVRTLSGVFGWVTSPVVVDRLRRDLSLVDSALQVDVTDHIDDNAVLVSSKANGSSRVVIEDLMLEAKTDTSVDTLAHQLSSLCLARESHKILCSKFRKDLMVLSETHFRHLLELGTEVVARNQLDENKTSKNLWYMELIPRDTLFYSVIMAEDSRNSADKGADALLNLLAESLSEGYVQLGGNETLGHGWCAALVHSAESLKKTLKPAE